MSVELESFGLRIEIYNFFLRDWESSYTRGNLCSLCNTILQLYSRIRVNVLCFPMFQKVNLSIIHFQLIT